MTICRYCMAEVSEREIEAEDGCCPECGALIAAGAGYLGQDEELDDDFDNLEEDETFELDEEEAEDGDFNEFDDDAFFEEEDESEFSEFSGDLEEEEPEEDEDEF